MVFLVLPNGWVLLKSYKKSLEIGKVYYLYGCLKLQVQQITLRPSTLSAKRTTKKATLARGDTSFFRWNVIPLEHQ
jgi:hypothetical protein